MGTIKIEIPGRTDRTFHVDSAGSAEIVLKEVRTLLDRNGKNSSESVGSDKRAKERLANARRYLKGLEKNEASREALRVADEMRKGWIRENG